MNMPLNLFQLYRHVLGPDPSEIHRSLCPSYVVDNSLSHACLKKTEDAVLAIPGRPDWNRSAKSFDRSDESHRKQMWIARVVLFFKCNFRGPGPQDKPIPCVLALLSRLREFTAPDARKSPHTPYVACNWH